MIIYPAIDLKDGKCVRLVQGDMTRDTVYNDDPSAQALDWARAGFSWLHIVDLDGAVHGAPENQHAVRDIIKAADIPIQLGGGIRTHAQIEHWISEGISRVILGTAAVRDPDLVRQACNEFPGQIAVGIDALGGEVMVDGWVDGSNIQATELAKHFEDAGVACIIYTDIERDGTGKGVNVVSTISLAQSTNIPVIASGGVHSLEDIKLVRDAAEYGVNGVVVGRALYDETIKPEEALKVAGGS
ncbi:MAG: 1-(5-phosphoribosyl)-5-[(5-phosphoribosylamino) me thylideneamino] imidazole-4-carboxamide isomerase [Micavibrio sp.]|nr:MAG: 1-(5-phosphoribosyl)-5-[(5-phosphoribosylamino) me thylideneamino] imidazole-4-carboxamide isomerase [Micavibrio sp.]